MVGRPKISPEFVRAFGRSPRERSNGGVRRRCEIEAREVGVWVAVTFTTMLGAINARRA